MPARADPVHGCHAGAVLGRRDQPIAPRQLRSQRALNQVRLRQVSTNGARMATNCQHSGKSMSPSGCWY